MADDTKKKTDPLDGEPFDENPLYYRSNANSIHVPGYKDLQDGLNHKSDIGHLHPATDIIHDPYHRFVTDEQIDKWDVGPLYDTDVPIYWEHGGIKEGETFDNQTMQQMFTRILYPYIGPDVSGEIISPLPGVYELGSTVSIKSVNIHTKRRSHDLTSIQICHGSVTAANYTTGINKGGDFTIPCNINLTSNTTIFTKVYDETSTIKKVDIATYTFENPIYFGSLEVDTVPTESQIKGLTKKVIVAGEGIECIFNCKYSRMTFAYPSEWGALVCIQDMNGLDLTDTFAAHNINITCLDNMTRTYRVLVNNRSTISNFKVKFQW